ncbi:MAG: hypothetical protein DWQ10_09855 [Calditrichaeota bacterium]|nr:MAG: hypothetical protein DWQ10_09855 [Calditrichota bacterium]
MKVLTLQLAVKIQDINTPNRKKIKTWTIVTVNEIFLHKKVPLSEIIHAKFSNITYFNACAMVKLLAGCFIKSVV